MFLLSPLWAILLALPNLSSLYTHLSVRFSHGVTAAHGVNGLRQECYLLKWEEGR